MMLRPSSTFITLLGAIASTLACVIPSTPLSNNITDKFQIFVQNPAFPIIHDSIMNFRPNGNDNHLVLRPAGNPTYDTIWLENGFLRNEDRYAVIDLEYNPNDNTTKMFMTDRQYATALFKAVYGCDPDTDELQIRLVLVARLADPDEGQAEEDGGQIGIQEAGYTGVYEFRYSPANNSLLTSTWYTVNLVIFRDGITPPVTTTTSTASSPTSTASIADYEYVSCWAEPADGSRTLTTVYSSSTNMTNEVCAVDCGGSVYFGTQYSVECWCGSTLGNGSSAAPETDCNDACSGNATEACGGGRRLSLYHLISANSTATTITSTSSTLLSSPTSSLSISPSPTVSSTTSSLTTSSTLSSTSSTSTTSTQLSTSTTTTASTPTGSSISTGLPSVGAYSFVSCWVDSAGSRALSAAFEGTEDLTLAKCAAFCSNYPYFGTEWSSECWCGYNLTAGSAAAPLSDCNYACTGDATETCGGSLRLSLYENLAWTAPADPSSIGSYDYYGCLTDSPDRTLASKSMSSSAMTLEMCATFCSGYTYFGAEWSVECYCGNSFISGSATVDSSNCSMTCGGNNQELCGAGDRLSVYQLAAV